MFGERPKTAEELNLELYQKVGGEFQQFRTELLSMSPEQILEHAYEYAIRKDIVLALEYHEIHARQAEALLKAGNSLDRIFAKWENHEGRHMEEIRNTIECTANEISREEFRKAVLERKARERDER